MSASDVVSDELATRTMDGLRRIVHALRVATRSSQRTIGLSSAQLFVLRQLSAAPDQSLSELAQRTRTTPSSVSEVVARLVRLGVVARAASEHDRRRAVLRAGYYAVDDFASAAIEPAEMMRRAERALDHVQRTQQRETVLGFDQIPS